ASERCPSGRRGTPGERVYRNPVSWVRIPPSPQTNAGLNFEAGIFYTGCRFLAGSSRPEAEDACRQPDSQRPTAMLSMTGFGRGTAQVGQTTATVEMRSVNSRYCEVSVRLPRSLAERDTEVQNLVRQALERGRITVQVQIEQAAA